MPLVGWRLGTSFGLGLICNIRNYVSMSLSRGCLLGNFYIVQTTEQVLHHDYRVNQQITTQNFTHQNQIRKPIEAQPSHRSHYKKNSVLRSIDWSQNLTDWSQSPFATGFATNKIVVAPSDGLRPIDYSSQICDQFCDQ